MQLFVHIPKDCDVIIEIGFFSSLFLNYSSGKTLHYKPQALICKRFSFRDEALNSFLKKFFN
jgi:hypothetical protein